MNGENDIIHDKSLRKYSNKKSKVEDWIFHINGRVRNFEISAPISLGFVLV